MESLKETKEIEMIDEAEIRVFTLNCWGLKWVSKDRPSRMESIGTFLSGSPYDLVIFQEVWTHGDFDLLTSYLMTSFPFHHFFENGIIGSGTAIFTKVPIESATFHEFSMNGYPQNIFHGDWFAAKGLGVINLTWKGFHIHVYTSHYHAEYNPERDVYLGHRILHAVESAQWINLTSSSADLTIYAGDFNTEPASVAYKLLTSLTPLTDSWTEVHGNTTSGGTSETCYNSYTPEAVKLKFPEGKRIDYIMYRTGPNIEGFTLNSELPLQHRIPGKDFSYSDHEAVSSVIKIKRLKACFQSGPEFRRELSVINQDERLKSVRESVEIIRKSYRAVVHADKLRYSIYSFVLAICLVSTVLPSAFLKADYHLATDVIMFFPRIIFTVMFIFFVLMATLFNKRERHALKSTEKSLQIILNVESYKKCNEVSQDIIISAVGDVI